MCVPREVIRDNIPQEFITRYSVNDYTIKLNRCYNCGLLLQKIDKQQLITGSVSSVGREYCQLQSGRSWVRFPGLDQYSGS